VSKAKEIGGRIAQARREKGVRERRDIRPVDVARALEVSGASVSDWESGKIVPREELMVRLAAYLGTTPQWLRYAIPADYVPAATPDPALDRKVTPAELAAAKRLVEASTPRRGRRRSGGS
jgi:transcriptional regulator with XRE-family HTH domain